eukprot:115083_1
MASTKKKGALSKRLKNMKFMKRKSSSAKRKTKQNDKKAKIEAMQWIQSDAAESSLIIDDRPDEYMMYRTGRKSFGNFNTVIEKMQKQSNESIQVIKNESINTKDKKKNTSTKRSLTQFQSENKEDLTDGNDKKKQKTDLMIKPQPLL